MNLNLNERQLEMLLKTASAKLGTTPEALKNQLQNGTFDKALTKVSDSQGEMLKKALSDPKQAEKLLSTPQAQAIYKKLTGK